MVFLRRNFISVLCLETCSSNSFTGNPPLVIARGGVSGVFPDSSEDAYMATGLASLENVIVWCDVQLTKDGFGICLPNIKLENATDIANILQNKKTSYLVNGVPTLGYFAVDYTLKELSNVQCKFNLS